MEAKIGRLSFNTQSFFKLRVHNRRPLLALARNPY